MVGLFAWVRSRLRDLLFMRRLERCFKKLKYTQHHIVSFPRFYHILKCEEFEVFNPDWKYIVFLFHYHNSTIHPDYHLVIRFLRWLQS
jgi:hypothetical protein